MTSPTTATTITGDPSSGSSRSNTTQTGSTRPEYHALSAPEREWRDRQPYLLGEGLELRSRYQLGWKPSWLISGKDPRECDDGPPRSAFGADMDARLIETNGLVNVKYVSSYFHPHEVSVMEYLNEPGLRQEKDNHCIPLVKALRPSKETSFIVTPLMRRYDDPPFDTLGEVVDFLNQTLKGLAFMHDHNVAYRCPSVETAVDPTPLYPEMFHPISPNMSRDLKSRAPRTTRTRHPSKYYLTDFSDAQKYKGDTGRNAGPLPRGPDQDQPPEFRESDAPRDPFPTDVWYLGDKIRRELLERYNGLEILEPLVKDMTKGDPASRPTMENVVDTWADIRSMLSRSALRSRLVRKDEASRGWMIRLSRNVKHAFRTVGYRMQGLEPIPSL